jgi:hypothetical protein
MCQTTLPSTLPATIGTSATLFASPFVIKPGILLSTIVFLIIRWETVLVGISGLMYVITSPTFSDEVGTRRINTNEPGGIVGRILPVGITKAFQPLSDIPNSSKAPQHAASTTTLILDSIWLSIFIRLTLITSGYLRLSLFLS